MEAMAEKPMDEASHPLYYHLPAWFLKHNVQLHADTKHSKLDLCKVESKGAITSDQGKEDDNPDGCHQQSDFRQSTLIPMTEEVDTHAGEKADTIEKEGTVDSDLFDQLEDTLAGALTMPQQSSRLVTAPSLLLFAGSEAEMHHTDHVVRHAAAKLSANAVSFDLDDLQELAFDFYSQDEARERKQAQLSGDSQTNTASSHELPESTSPMEVIKFYFAVRSSTNGSSEARERWKRGIDALFTFAGENRESTEGRHGDLDTPVMEADSKQAPLLVHLINGSQYVDVDYRQRIISRFREAILNRRESGGNALLVVSDVDHHDKFCYKCLTKDSEDRGSSTAKRLYKKLRLDLVSIVKISSKNSSESLKTCSKSCCRGTSARRLARLIRGAMPEGTALDALVCLTKCSTRESSLAATLDDHCWSYDDLRRASRQICGRAFRRSELREEDISAVLRRLLRLNTEEESKEQENGEDKDKDNADKNIVRELFERKLDKLRETCNEFERSILDNAVNPADLTAGYDEVTMDAESKNTVKQLLSLRKRNVNGASLRLLEKLQIKGIMFYGPPGTGKTLLARAIAKDANANMIAVDTASLINKYTGETEKSIKAAFDMARRLTPCVLFLDEVDALFYKRTSGDKSWERSALTSYLQQMDGLSSGANNAPFVVVATNRPWDLDEAFLRRLPHKILFSLPCQADREQILRIFLHPDDLSPEVSVSDLAKRTAGFSGSDLQNLCGQAALAWTMTEPGAEDAVNEENSAVRVSLTGSHFEAAFARTTASVSNGQVQDIEAFSSRFGWKASKLPISSQTKSSYDEEEKRSAASRAQKDQYAEADGYAEYKLGNENKDVAFQRFYVGPNRPGALR